MFKWLLLCGIALLLSASSIWAGDKPVDEGFFEHPVFDYPKPEKRDIQKSRIAAMKMTAAQIRAAVPTQTGLMNVGCPNPKCKQGSKWNNKRNLPKPYPWKFNPHKPNQIVCPDCREVYPNNPKFPMIKSETIVNPAQEKIKMPYWEDKNRKRKRTKFFLKGMLNAAQWDWYQKQMSACAQGYQATGDEDFAYKACVLLDALCDVFPHWVICDNYGDGYKSYPKGTRVDNDDTRIGRRTGSENFGGAHMRMVYDICYNSQGMKRVSEEIGRDLRQKFIEHVVKFTNPELFDLATPLRPSKWTQSCPGHEKVIAGKLLHQPRLLRFFIDCMHEAPYRVYGSDGAFFQGPGYGSIHLFNMMHMRNLNGYGDPSDYQIPKGEKRHERFWFPYGPYETFHKQAYTIWRDICRPDGASIVFNDSGGGYTSASFMDRSKRASSGNVMKHGLKHVVLGDGAGNDQAQVHMGFGEGGKHSHTDTLGLQMYAFGHYLIDDITYPKHRLRKDYSSSQFHNTVTVDMAEQVPHLTDGDPLLYEPRIPGIAAVRVDASRSFPGVTEIYERTLVHVTTDMKRPYVIDVFRIKGGQLHDYMLLSSYRHPSHAALSLATRKLPGTRPLMPKHIKWQAPTMKTGATHPYGIFNNVQVADAAKNFTLTYRLKQPWEKDKALYQPVGKPAVGTRHHFITEGGKVGMVGKKKFEAVLSEIPRRADGTKPLTELTQMPQFMLRSKSKGELTTFIAVHEPFMDKPRIHSVRRLPSDAGVVALEVKLKDANGKMDRVDRIVLASEGSGKGKSATYARMDGKQKDVKQTDGMITDAKLAVVSRLSDGKTVGAMVGGTVLKDRTLGVELTQKVARYQGSITRSLRKWDGAPLDAFEVSGDILPPVGDALNGAWLFVKNRGVMQRIPDGLSPTDFKEWENKYHKRSEKKVKQIGLNKTENPAVAAWLRGEKRVKATPHTGGGWSFEIERVIERDGRRLIVCKKDHGLKVDARTCQELFYPHRKMQGKLSEWWIYTAASTQPLKDLRAKKVVLAVNQPEVRRQLKAGLLFRRNEQRPQVLADGDLQWRLFKLPPNHLYRFQGYLRVPESGDYTFHYRPGTDGSLDLGGKTVIERTGRIGTPMPRVVHVRLKKGLVPIEFTIDVRKTNKYWKPSSEFEWEGPSVDRRALRFSDFVCVAD